MRAIMSEIASNEETVGCHVLPLHGIVAGDCAKAQRIGINMRRRLNSA